MLSSWCCSYCLSCKVVTYSRGISKKWAGDWCTDFVSTHFDERHCEGRSHWTSCHSWVFCGLTGDCSQCVMMFKWIIRSRILWNLGSLTVKSTERKPRRTLVKWRFYRNSTKRTRRWLCLESWEGLLFVTDVSTTSAEATFREVVMP